MDEVKYKKKIETLGIVIKPLLPELLVSFLQHPNNRLWESWLEDVYLSYNESLKEIKKHIASNKESYGMTISDIEEAEEFSWGWLFTFYASPVNDNELVDLKLQREWEEYSDKWDNYTLPFQSYCVMKFLDYIK